MAEINYDIKNWIKIFAQCVRDKDFEGAKKLYFKDIYCFGSIIEAVSSINDLSKNQWEVVWPNITDFQFDEANAYYEIAESNDLACVMMSWTSIGYSEDGGTFKRPGRVTILLKKDTEQNKWLAYHTHYSLTHGTPYLTRKQKS